MLTICSSFSQPVKDLEIDIIACSAFLINKIEVIITLTTVSCAIINAARNYNYKIQETALHKMTSPP